MVKKLSAPIKVAMQILDMVASRKMELEPLRRAQSKNIGTIESIA